jgi:hypothetical protein
MPINHRRAVMNPFVTAAKLATTAVVVSWFGAVAWWAYLAVPAMAADKVKEGPTPQ